MEEQATAKRSDTIAVATAMERQRNVFPSMPAIVLLDSLCWEHNSRHWQAWEGIVALSCFLEAVRLGKVAALPGGSRRPVFEGNAEGGEPVADIVRQRPLLSGAQP